MAETIIVHGRAGELRQGVLAGEHRIVVDEPLEAGGMDAGPTPHHLLLAALGACTAITVRFPSDLQTIDDTTEEEARVMSVLTKALRSRLEDDGRFFRVQLENVAEDEYRASEIVDRFESVPQRLSGADPFH